MKFSGSLQFATLLAELHAEYIVSSEAPLPELIVPVPLHFARMRERGFNQALELSRLLSQQLALPYSVELCSRHRSVPAQRGLSARQRRVNLRDAFMVKSLQGVSHIALVDDVMTTGSTFNELAKAFKRAGVSQVDVWPMARAL